MKRSFSLKKILPQKKLLSIAYLFFGLVILGYFGYTVYNERSIQGLPGEVKKCNNLSTQLRFSCFRSALQKHYNGDSVEKYLEEIETTQSINFSNDDKSYAIFGTNCHTYYHAVGDFIASNAKKEDKVKDLINQCPLACTSGCAMGLFKRTAINNNFTDEILKEIYGACREGERAQCSHEVGHALNDRYVSPIVNVLDDISSKQFGLNYNPKPTYKAPAKIDFNATFEDCKKLVPAKQLQYCYTGIGHNMFLFSKFSKESYLSQFKHCKEVDPKNEESCYAYLLFRVGINEAAPRYITNQASAGNKACEDAIAMTGKPELMYHCYIGLGGGIGLFTDSEYPNFSFKIYDRGYLDRIRDSVEKYATICEKAPKDFQINCYRGLLGTGYRYMFEVLGLSHEPINVLLPEFRPKPDNQEEQFFRITG